MFGIVFPFQRVKFICVIGRKGALSETEKFKIMERLHSKVIAKKLGRDHRTVKTSVISSAQCNGRSDKGKIWEEAPVSHRAMGQIKKEVRRNPLQTSKVVFESAGVPHVSKST